VLITKNCDVTINSSNIRHYNKLGYNNIKVKEKIVVDINELTKGSHVIVDAKCDICGHEKETSYKRYLENINNYNIFSCSRKCANIKRIKTNLEKYGIENISQNQDIKDKKIKTCLKNFGVEYSTQSNVIQEKIKKTSLEKYGVERPSQNNEIKEQSKKTCLEKYGVESPMKDNDIVKKMKIRLSKTLLDKIFKYKNIISYYDDGLIMFCDKCNNNFEIKRNLFYNRKQQNTIMCTICNTIGNHTSGLEILLYEFIKENYNKKIVQNTRSIISPLELDIYLPELKLAFEFNGLFWHNEITKDKNYHLSKTEECEKQGIQLIHIYEDDWLYKQDIIKSMILNKLNQTTNKIFARKTTIKEIDDNKLVREFLEINHIQGFVGSKVKLGLFYDNELISLMTFGNRRIAMGKKSTNEGEYELLRFCNKLNTSVIGGASKLFKYFINNYKPKEVTTYADRSISQGKLYETLGFKSEGKTQPNYYYIINSIKYHRFNYRKDKLVKQGFDSNKTEHEIMINRKIFRIYDSGNLKYKIKI